MMFQQKILIIKSILIALSSTENHIYKHDEKRGLCEYALTLFEEIEEQSWVEEKKKEEYDEVPG